MSSRVAYSQETTEREQGRGRRRGTMGRGRLPQRGEAGGETDNALFVAT
jgi:hypothetical protein